MVRLTRRLLIVFLVWLFSVPGIAQVNLVDPSKCYSDVLRDVKIVNASDEFRLAYASLIYKDNYEQHKGSLSALIPDVGVLSYEAFDERRAREFHQRNLNIEAVRRLAIQTFTLNPQAKDIITKCIDALTSGGNGLFVVRYDVNEQLVQMTLRWRPYDSAAVLSIGDSTLINGTVVSPRNVQANHLLPSGFKLKGTANQPFLISRADPSKPITAVLDKVSPASIDPPLINFEPMPMRVSCQAAWVSTDPSTGAPLRKTSTFALEDKKASGRPTGFYDDPRVDGRWGARFHIDMGIPEGGVISSVTCNKLNQEQMCMDNSPDCNYVGPVPGEVVNATTARCAGSSNANPRVVTMTVDWKVADYACTPIPWATASQK